MSDYIERDVTLVVTGKTAKFNDKVYIFKGDKDIQLNIEIIDTKMKYSRTNPSGNVLLPLPSNCYAKVGLLKPKGEQIIRERVPIVDNKVAFVIDESICDELEEIGIHKIQIQIWATNEETSPRWTLPSAAELEVLKPDVDFQENQSNVSVAKVGEAKTNVKALSTQRPTLNDEGLYNKKEWIDNEVITKEDLNTIEAGIYKNSSSLNNIANELGRNKDNTEIDMGTTSTNVRGAIKELKDNMDNIGQPTNEQISTAVNNYLAENPIEVDSTVVKLSDTKIIGEIWNNPTDVTYMAWPLGCLQYDNDLDMIVQICGCNATHTEANDASGCYIAYINPNTYEVTDPVKILDSEGNHIKNCSGFCITKDGEWLLTVNYTLYRSSDKGVTWTLQGEFVDSEGTALNTTYSIISAYRNFYQFKSGRLAVGAWSSNKVYIFYSDDNGLTWSASLVGQIATGNQEPCFIEMEEGKILSVIRKTMYGTGLTDWNSTAKRIIEPAYISHSEDNGNTWSTPVASTKLTEMTACPCFGFNHEDEGIVELFYCSRYEHGNSEGVMYQTKATYEDARNDNFDEPVVVLYPTSPKKETGTGSDFGYITGCKDGKGKLHLVYYDVSNKNQNIVTYKYILADREKVVFPRNNNIINPIVGWSSEEINKRIQKMYTKVLGYINQIDANINGDEDYNSDSITMSGIIFNLLAENYDASALTITDTVNSLSSSVSLKDGFESIEGYIPPASINIPAINEYFTDVKPSELTFEVAFKLNRTKCGYNIQITGTSSNWIAFQSMADNGCIRHTYIDTSDTAKYLNSSGTSLTETTGNYVISYIFCNDGALKRYVNGILVDTITHDDFKSWTDYFKSTSNFYMNAEYTKAIRVYNRALSADEVLSNYKAQQF